MRLIGYLIVNILALLITAYIVPGFDLHNITAAIVASVVIGIINTVIKPLVKFITLPINFLTLGIFGLVLNVLFLMGAAAITPGFEIDGYLPAILGSIALSLVSSFLGMLR